MEKEIEVIFDEINTEIQSDDTSQIKNRINSYLDQIIFILSGLNETNVEEKGGNVVGYVQKILHDDTENLNKKEKDALEKIHAAIE